MSKSVKKNAFVILFMNAPHYIHGVLATAYSLRKSNTKHNIVCMLTNDLFVYKELLEHIFDEVIIIPYLIYNNNTRLQTLKQHNIYKNWKNISYTKWQCLMLSNYDKICLLDADLIIQTNIDHLFKLDNPAGCWGNTWDSKVAYYDEFKYGNTIDANQINKGLIDGYLVNGHCVMLTLTKGIYARFKKFMNKHLYIKNNKCLAMYDEVAIVKFMISEGKEWQQIGRDYNTVPWKYNNSIESNDCKILHYFNIPKPWQMQRNKWPDLKIWYDNWDQLIESYPIIKKVLSNCF
jgi:lipopolysaccharide biosynthesis glycosyltransferase